MLGNSGGGSGARSPPCRSPTTLRPCIVEPEHGHLLLRTRDPVAAGPLWLHGGPLSPAPERRGPEPLDGQHEGGQRGASTSSVNAAYSLVGAPSLSRHQHAEGLHGRQGAVVVVDSF
ncbi:hypothetical protein E2562_004598 [Oryza meyeriana var. granulata]|uniref:Uncharacterized protein n=1 Tax=Oryza meyeriana var. granulata TaxID=110450 RepID=A0A6G1F3S0_9ORYZ|nr:hypothetical protein E2562_004598 [Oryza meyeriana var. granulata]